MSITGFQLQAIRDYFDDKQDGNYKTYYDYDVSGNVTGVYKAPANAAHGASCIKITFEYASVAGTDVVKKKEYTTSTWDSSWDI